MESINITNARDNFYKLINNVAQTHIPVLIKGKDNDAVLISADDWRSIEETLYLTIIPKMVESIKQSANEPLSDFTPLEEVEW